MYFAIIGDIKQSKSIKTRREIQNRLKAILDLINNDFDEDIAAKFIITLGDEFQGLLSSAKNIIQIIDRIQFNLFPIRLRFGIGFGGIETDINKDMALGADGPAYHYARNMIDHIKIIEKGKMYGSSNIMFYAINNIEITSLINSNLQLCSFIEHNWTIKQRQLLVKIILEHKNQNKAAEELGIVQSSVQRRLKAAGYYDYINAKDLLAFILYKIWGDKDGN